MKAKLAKWGNSLALRLPRQFVTELGLSEGSVVELDRDGSKLVAETRTAGRIPHYRLEDLLATISPSAEPPPVENWPAVEPRWPDDDWSDIAPTDADMDADMGPAPDRKIVGQRHAIRRPKRS